MLSIYGSIDSIRSQEGGSLVVLVCNASVNEDRDTLKKYKDFGYTVHPLPVPMSKPRIQRSSVINRFVSISQLLHQVVGTLNVYYLLKIISP